MPALLTWVYSVAFLQQKQAFLQKFKITHQKFIWPWYMYFRINPLTIFTSLPWTSACWSVYLGAIPKFPTKHPFRPHFPQHLLFYRLKRAPNLRLLALTFPEFLVSFFSVVFPKSKPEKPAFRFVRSIVE